MAEKYLALYSMVDGVASTLDAALFNPRWQDIDSRLNALEVGKIPSWTSATRPVPNAGEYYVGFNTQNQQFEGFNGTDWIILG